MTYPLLPNQFSPALKKVWRQTDTIATLCLIGAGFLGLGALHFFDLYNQYWLWGLMAYFLLVLCGYVVGLLLIPYRYHFQRYQVTADELQFQSGYFFRETTYVPIQRIQHMETAQGPLLRRVALMSLTIHTAGTTHEIAGLATADALALQEQVAHLVKAGHLDV